MNFFYFFYNESKSKKKIFFGGGGGGGGREGGRGEVDGQMNRPKPICPFNFFEVGGITINKCRSYVPDKLNLYPFYSLTFKCGHGLQPT